MSVLTARILQCVFGDTPMADKYAYFTNDPTIQAGDLVVVAVPKDYEKNSFALPFTNEDRLERRYVKIVKVISTEETVEGIERVREWIISKIDTTGYNERRSAEKARALLIAKIKRAKEEALEALTLDTLKSMSPELDKLITELAALNNKG